MALKTEMKIQIANGITQMLSFKDAGFCGMLPAFNTRPEAEAWADGKCIIVEGTFPDEEDKKHD